MNPPPNPHWLPDQSGRIIVVTGANSGLGFETSRSLAAAGAHVVLACRSPERGERALDDLRRALPDAELTLEQLDLADLASVRSCAERLRQRFDAIDVLINNAGVMALPFRTTADGFEMQLGTNHLGHFALTAELFGLLQAAADDTDDDDSTPGAATRVVNVSSLAHRMGRIDLRDPHGERGYQKWLAYGQSKLANMLFTLELQRRLHRAHVPILAVACHPGYAATELQFQGARMAGQPLVERLMGAANRWVAQSATDGALPTVFAAAADAVRPADFIGPDGFMQMRGQPTRVERSQRARDHRVAGELWAFSLAETGAIFDVL